MTQPPQIEKLSSQIGAQISNIDLSQPDDADIRFIKAALVEHLVVFVRNQHLEPQSFYELASKFGEPTPYPFVDGIEGYPEIVEIKKTPEETINFGGVWHSDTAYLAAPASGALLYGIDIPPTGGDTLFSNLYAAYDSLSEGLKQFLDSMTAINDADKDAISQTRPDSSKRGIVAEHPVIRTHPESGKKVLFVNRAHTTSIAGMTDAESTPLLEYLYGVAEREEFCCRLKWQPGSLAIWDNCACQHFPINDYDGQMRRMHRISLAGGKPF